MGRLARENARRPISVLQAAQQPRGITVSPKSTIGFLVLVVVGVLIAGFVANKFLSGSK